MAKKMSTYSKACSVLGLEPPPAKKHKASTHVASANPDDAVVSIAAPSIVYPDKVDGSSSAVDGSVVVEDMGVSLLPAPPPLPTDAVSVSVAHVDAGGVLSHAELTAQIKHRAHAVSKDREWTAIFDPLVYFFFAQATRVVLLRGPGCGPCEGFCAVVGGLHRQHQASRQVLRMRRFRWQIISGQT